MGYRFVDHTADVAFEVFGDSLEELIVNATNAFYEAFVYIDRLDENRVLNVDVEADSPDYLLYNWLNELLYAFDTEFFGGKFVEFVEIDEGDNLTARGTIRGGNLKPEIVKVEPKAITLHDFSVEKKNGWKAYVVIDI
ncbi:MAG: archease [Archaeoglobales archaeon]|nr:MAG: archease [Archaeoglobales archaeon]